MTVQELISILEEMNPNAEVRLAQQPSYPFEYSVSDVIERNEVDFDGIYNDLMNEGLTHEQAMQKAIEATESSQATVYIGEGSQLGYLDKEVSELLNW